MRTYITVAFNERSHKRIYTRTSARTRAGIMRAIGKQVAHDLGTDVFECHGLVWHEGASKDYAPRDLRQDRLSPAEERLIWEAAHNELM